MTKIAIVGASYLQLPLIRKAKERGLETYVFAWAANDVGEKEADKFYPISIIEKENILKECRKIGIAGICSIASDLAMVTVNYVAAEMGLVGNSMQCVQFSTNKYEMRKRFKEMGDPSAKFVHVEEGIDLTDLKVTFPVIVKPVDRSGSRGVTKIHHKEEIHGAVFNALERGFKKEALIEEYIDGEEYSVEAISWQGEHNILAITKKFTTGEPYFIETAHLEPAQLSANLVKRIESVVIHALDSLEIKFGASHTEIKITGEGDIRIIEIGGRMGGDCIGSDLVYLSTGVDFVNAVLDVSLGICPWSRCEKKYSNGAMIKYIFDENDIGIVRRVKKEHPEYIVREDIQDIDDRIILDSSNRYGYILMCAKKEGDLLLYL